MCAIRGRDITIEKPFSVAIRAVNIMHSCRAVPCPYTVLNNNSNPRALADLHGEGFYVWDSRALKAANANVPLKTAQSGQQWRLAQVCAPDESASVLVNGSVLLQKPK